MVLRTGLKAIVLTAALVVVVDAKQHFDYDSRPHKHHKHHHHHHKSHDSVNAVSTTAEETTEEESYDVTDGDVDISSSGIVEVDGDYGSQMEATAVGDPLYLDWSSTGDASYLIDSSLEGSEMEDVEIEGFEGSMSMDYSGSGDIYQDFDIGPNESIDEEIEVDGPSIIRVHYGSDGNVDVNVNVKDPVEQKVEKPKKAKKAKTAKAAKATTHETATKASTEDKDEEKANSVIENPATIAGGIAGAAAVMAAIAVAFTNRSKQEEETAKDVEEGRDEDASSNDELESSDDELEIKTTQAGEESEEEDGDSSSGNEEEEEEVIESTETEKNSTRAGVVEGSV